MSRVENNAPASEGQADETRGFRVVDRRLATLLDEGADIERIDAAAGERNKPTVVRQLEEKVAFYEKALADREAKVNEVVAAVQQSQHELEQYKSRLRREREEEIERQRGFLVARFFDVLDNLRRTLTAAEAAGDAGAADALKQGVRLVHEQFLAVLAELGVERIATVGAPFDPARHEALMTRAVTDPAQSGTVVEEIRCGFKRGEQVLRAAQVVVGAAGTP